MKTIQKKYEELKKNNKLEQEVTQAESQEDLEWLRHNHTAPRSQLKCRTKDLKSALSKKKPQKDFNENKLEMLSSAILKELILRKFLSNELNNLHRVNETLAEVKTNRLGEKQKTGSVSASPAMRPVLQSPWVANLNELQLSKENLFQGRT